jgi:single-strand DNA-binding protein
MGMTLNRATIIGNTGQPPECRTLGTGNKIAKFSLATEHRFKKGEEWQSKTDWHRVTAFGKQAEFVESYVGKGHRLYVEGRIEYSTSEGEDGVTRYYTDIIADKIIALDSKNGTGKQHTPFDDD